MSIINSVDLYLHNLILPKFCLNRFMHKKNVQPHWTGNISKLWQIYKNQTVAKAPPPHLTIIPTTATSFNCRLVSRFMIIRFLIVVDKQCTVIPNHKPQYSAISLQVPVFTAHQNRRCSGVPLYRESVILLLKIIFQQDTLITKLIVYRILNILHVLRHWYTKLMMKINEPVLSIYYLNTKSLSVAVHEQNNEWVIYCRSIFLLII